MTHMKIRRERAVKNVIEIEIPTRKTRNVGYASAISREGID
jgi:hypothetical protein